MIIFWKGRGLLIPLLAIAGIGAGAALKGENASGFGVGPWLAAGFVWVFAVTFGKTTSGMFLDPATNQPVLVKRTHTLYFLPPFVWAIVLTGMALLLSFSDISDASKGLSGRSPEPSFAKATFDIANSLTGSGAAGTATGNSNEATELAKVFSATCKEARSMMIEKRASDRLGLTDHEFGTYVHLTPTRCVFLVQVPELRKFSRDAKDTMAAICWKTAQALASKLTPQRKTLAIGIRGTLLYERAYIGHVSTQANEVADGIELREDGGLSHKLLIPLFDREPAIPTRAKAPPSQSSATVAGVADKTPSTKPKAETQAAPLPASPTKPAPALPTAMREWKSNDGRLLRAALVRFLDDTKTTAEFRREDGQVFQVVLDRFGPDDTQFISSLPLH